MAKKTKPQEIKLKKQDTHLEEGHLEGISRRGKIIIFYGIGLLVIGFFILSKTNPQGDNWASILSPILLISGYLTIALGIIS